MAGSDGVTALRGSSHSKKQAQGLWEGVPTSEPSWGTCVIKGIQAEQVYKEPIPQHSIPLLNRGDIFSDWLPNALGREEEKGHCHLHC